MASRNPYSQAPQATGSSRTNADMRNSQQSVGATNRVGLVGWWLNLTAPRWPAGFLPIAERERLRKAELTSFSILAVFLFLIALVSNTIADPATAQAVVLMAIGLIIAAFLNRSGRTRAAAYLIPGLLMALIALAIVGLKGGLQQIILPAYDLFVLPIFLTSLIGNRRAPWIFSFIAAAFIISDFFLQPHGRINAPGATNFDDIAYQIKRVGYLGAINRHVALCLFAGFFGWLGARSVDMAIARADSAEAMAALEHQVSEQRRQLEVGAQQILETHVRAANGDFAARANVSQGNVLWNVAASLNNLLSRMQKMAGAEHFLRRTEEELQRLASAIDIAQAGRRPIWPAPSGTAADLIIERISRGATRGGLSGHLNPPASQAPQQWPPMPQQIPGLPGPQQGQDNLSLNMRPQQGDPTEWWQDPNVAQLNPLPPAGQSGPGAWSSGPSGPSIAGGTSPFMPSFDSFGAQSGNAPGRWGSAQPGRPDQSSEQQGGQFPDEWPSLNPRSENANQRWPGQDDSGESNTSGDNPWFLPPGFQQ